MPDLLEQLGITRGGNGSGEGTGSVRSRGLAPGTELPPGPHQAPQIPEARTAVQVSVEQGPPPPAFGKVTQQDSSYTPAGPEPFICGNCIYYLPYACQLVDGEIDAEGACRFFRPIPPQAGLVSPGSAQSGGEDTGPAPATPPPGPGESTSDGWEGMEEPVGEPAPQPADEGWGG